jgi:hypothetical protein
LCRRAFCGVGAGALSSGCTSGFTSRSLWSPRGAWIAGCAFSGAAFINDLAPTRQLVHGGLLVLGRHVPGRLPVKVIALVLRDQGFEVRRGGGVPAQHDGHHALGKDAWRALLDIHLDAQLDGFGCAAKQRGKQFCQTRCRLGWRQALFTRCDRRGRRVWRRYCIGLARWRLHG